MDARTRFHSRRASELPRSCARSSRSWRTAGTCPMSSSRGRCLRRSSHSFELTDPPRVALHDVIQPHITTIDYDGRKLDVSCRIAFDGVEYVGRLWFADQESGDTGLPDRGALPGRSRDEVVALAER